MGEASDKEVLFVMVMSDLSALTAPHPASPGLTRLIRQVTPIVTLLSQDVLSKEMEANKEPVDRSLSELSGKGAVPEPPWHPCCFTVP